MTAWVRSGVLAEARELAAELGLDPMALAKEVGVDLASLANPDFPIPGTAVVRFLELAAKASGCETFGLVLSRKQGLSLFGPLWPLFRNAPTLGDLMRSVVDYFPLHTRGALMSLEARRGGATFVYDVSSDTGGSRRQVVELGLAHVVGEMRRGAPHWRPSQVTFRHARPHHLRAHREIFGENVQFEVDRNSVFIDDWVLERGYPGGDLQRHEQLVRTFEPQRRTQAGAVRLQTEIAVRSLLPFAPCQIDAVADLLRLSRRTLQRRLAEDGAKFELIVERVRSDLALTYVRDSRLTVTAIAEILQFSETSAFTRAFCRWHGTPPTRMRRREAIA